MMVLVLPFRRESGRQLQGCGGVGERGRRGGVVEAELGVEGWVMVDGVDECGELGACGDRLLEEGEVGDVDSEIGEVGWEVGRVVEASFEGVGKAF